MRVELLVDGRPESVIVDLAAGTVTVRGVPHPLKVVRAGGRAELEVDGEVLAVEGWPDGLPKPPGPVSVNGETVGLEVVSRGPEVSAVRASRPAAPSAEVEARAPASPPRPVPAGTPLHPPMPGRILEVRVADGATVRRGQVLVVLEAMKMRNEIASPADGRVADLRVAPGSNVRAGEAMLTIVPG